MNTFKLVNVGTVIKESIGVNSVQGWSVVRRRVGIDGVFIDNDRRLFDSMAARYNVAKDGRSSVEVRRQSLANAAVASPGVIHLSNYRRRRRARVGGPVVSLDAGIILQRSYTNVGSLVSFMIYAGIMVRSCISR